MKLGTRKSPISLREGRPGLFPSCLKQPAGGQAVDWGPFNAFCNVLSAEMSITMIMMMCPPSLLTEDAQRQQDLKELCKPASSSPRGPAARTLASSQPPAERGWTILQNLNLEFIFSGECHICLEYLINQLRRVKSWLNTFSPEQRDYSMSSKTNCDKFRLFDVGDSSLSPTSSSSSLGQSRPTAGKA